MRKTDGFVFHYPCYFAPPLSVIRVGDYKLMQHLLTGEQKLFNLTLDPTESDNLIHKNPTLASELKSRMADYLLTIDAEDVQEVYQARLRELDGFEQNSRSRHAKTLAQSGGDQTIIAEANARLSHDLERFDTNRKECKQNMKGTGF